MNRRLVVQTLLTSVSLFAVGCQRSANGLSKELIMQKYPMKSYAIGRFLIEVPEKAVFEGISIIFDGIEITPIKQRNNNLGFLAEQRIASLRSTNPKENKYVDSFISERRNQLIILYTDTPGYKGGGKIEAYVSIGNDGFLLKTLSAYGEDKKQDAIKFTREVLDLIKPFDSTSSAKTFLGDGYQIATLDPTFGEKAGAVFKLNETITIAFSTHVREPSTELGLIARTQLALKDPPLAKTVQVLRMNKRSLGDLEGDEVIYKNLKGSPEGGTHKFQWTFIGRNKLDAPELDLNMLFSGDPNSPAVMSDEEALGLWDSIFSSIRLRPGAI